MKEPTLEVEPRSTPRGTRRAKRAASRAGGRGTLRKWLRRIVAMMVVIALLPLALTPLYAVPFVRPVSMLMMADLVTLRGFDRQWTPIDDLGNRIVHSVMMSEDGQFCGHRGVDWGELTVVIEDFRAGEPTRGASTIPMQTVKNLFLWNGRSYLRKLLEIPLAIYFDLLVPKRRIMEIYLNIAEWGPGIYGAEAASQHYFGKPVRELTRRQAALMAVTLPNPRLRNPARPSRSMSRVAAIVERRAAQAGSYSACVD